MSRKSLFLVPLMVAAAALRLHAQQLEGPFHEGNDPGPPYVQSDGTPIPSNFIAGPHHNCTVGMFPGLFAPGTDPALRIIDIHDPNLPHLDCMEGFAFKVVFPFDLSSSRANAFDFLETGTGKFGTTGISTRADANIQSIQVEGDPSLLPRWYAQHDFFRLDAWIGKCKDAKERITFSLAELPEDQLPLFEDALHQFLRGLQSEMDRASKEQEEAKKKWEKEETKISRTERASHDKHILEEDAKKQEEENLRLQREGEKNWNDPKWLREEADRLRKSAEEMKKKAEEHDRAAESSERDEKKAREAWDRATDRLREAEKKGDEREVVEQQVKQGMAGDMTSRHLAEKERNRDEARKQRENAQWQRERAAQLEERARKLEQEKRQQKLKKELEGVKSSAEDSRKRK